MRIKFDMYQMYIYMYLTFQLFGYKADDRSVKLVLKVMDEAGELVQHIGP